LNCLIGNTQKVVTTVGYNKAGREVTVRKCSVPEKKLQELLQALNLKSRSFGKIKSVVHKPKLKKIENPVSGGGTWVHAMWFKKA
jgi:hypothetical protein